MIRFENMYMGMSPDPSFIELEELDYLGAKQNWKKSRKKKGNFIWASHHIPRNFFTSSSPDSKPSVTLLWYSDTQLYPKVGSCHLCKNYCEAC